MKKPQSAYNAEGPVKPLLPGEPNCPTCFSGIDPTIIGIEFAAALNE